MIFGKPYCQTCPENIQFAFNVVVSKLNESTYHTVKDWVDANIPTNRAGIKTAFYTHETNGFLNRFHDTDDRDPIEVLDKLDVRRKTDWKKTFPIVKL